MNDKKTIINHLTLLSRCLRNNKKQIKGLKESRRINELLGKSSTVYTDDSYIEYRLKELVNVNEQIVEEIAFFKRIL